MPALKTWKALRPLSLASYMAASAFLSRLSASRAQSGKMQRPTLTVTLTSRLPSMVGVDDLLEDGFGAALGVLLVAELGHDDDELVAAHAGDGIGLADGGAELLGDDVEQASPAEWPRESLMRLKWSMSTMRTATLCWLRLARWMAWRMRSSSRTRLGRPVSWSWWARWLTYSVSFLRSVMSKAMPR